MEELPKNESAVSEEAPLQEEEITDDYHFHVQRWERMAQAYKEKPWFLKLVQGQNPLKEKSADDFMYDEALRDNASFEKRQHEEYEQWHEHLKEVLQRLQLRRRYLDSPDDPESQEGKEIRPLLLILGGGMKGPYSAGQVVGLNEVGITADTFENIIGISAGAGTAAYYAAGPEQTKLGASIFYEECASKTFIDWARGLGRIMNVQVLTERFMGTGKKKLDEEAVHECPAGVYFGATKLEKGDVEPEEIFIDAKEAAPDLRTAMRASMTVPLVAGEVPPVNGVEYVDGAFDPLPIQKVIEQFDPTDILILPNVPFDRLDAFKQSNLEWVVAQVSKWGRKSDMTGSMVSLGQLEKFLLIKEQLRQSMEAIREERGVNIGMFFPPEEGLSALGTDGDQIKSAVNESARAVFREFGVDEPRRLDLV